MGQSKVRCQYCGAKNTGRQDGTLPHLQRDPARRGRPPARRRRRAPTFSTLVQKRAGHLERVRGVRIRSAGHEPALAPGHQHARPAGEVALDVDRFEARIRRQRNRRIALRLADLEHQRARPAQPRRRVPRRCARSPRARSGRRPAHHAAPSRTPRAAGRSPLATYGGLLTTTSIAPRRSGGQRVEPVAFDDAARATRRARGRRGWRSPRRAASATRRSPTPTATVRSAASDIAMTPEPVPRSTTVARRQLVDQRATRARRRPRSRDEGSARARSTRTSSVRNPQRPEHVLQRLTRRRAARPSVEVAGVGQLGRRRVEVQHELGAFATARLLDDAAAPRCGRRAGRDASSSSRRQVVPSANRVGQPARLLVVDERVGDLVEVAGQHACRACRS